ncbi:phosphatidate cytidylyltransferase, partial [Geosmithia morbida]
MGASKSKKGVRFPQRNTHNGNADARRSSISDISEDGSPTKQRAQAALEPKPPTKEQEAAEYAKKKANFWTRTLWTFIMIAIFFGSLFMGHIYIIFIITLVQIVSFKEVVAISNVPSRARSLSSTKSLNWYWLATTMYFLYGESFTNFAWTHMALYLIVFQAHFILNNVFEGMIWFFLPAALVITNDIFAYVCGIAFGRTQLIKLSPKKTVEGFLGAWIMTVVWAMLLVNLMKRSKYFICPVNDLGANIFTGLECDPNPVFLPHTYQLSEFSFLPRDYKISFTIAPIQFHALVLATFASLIAPFGGFFASGLKRTFKIKDFGDSIPGHGGMTDRMDCQFIMGFFAYVYYHSFIATYQLKLGSVLETAINGLSPDDQIELVKGMGRYLANQGIVSED